MSTSKPLSGNFLFLTWNQFGHSSAGRLADSLAYPGNSGTYDYTVSGEWPSELAEFYGTSRPVSGYINTDDDTDTIPSVGDGVTINGGVANSTDLRHTLNEHIDREHTLTVLAWRELDESGRSANIIIEAFVQVRLLGYRLRGGTNGWLLVEFIGTGDTCK